MPNKFEKYGFENANQVFSTLKKKLDLTRANRFFVSGDDWQDGKGWVGPQFEGNGKVAKLLKDEIKRDFAAKGDIRSVVRRQMRGTVGRVPGWLISSRNAPSEPDAETAKLIAEAQKILNEFWKNSKVHGTLKQVVTDYLTNGHGVLRLFFVQNDDGEAEFAEDVEAAVKQIHLFREEPDAGCVECDKKTLKFASFYRSEEDGNVFVEICYINDDGKTIFKKLSKNDSKDFAESNFKNSISKYIKDGETENSGEIELPLGGKLLVFELSGDSLVTSAMRSQQKIVNKGYTMLSHNLDMDGFRQTKILNGLPPGDFKKVGNEMMYVPNPDGEEVGAGAITYTTGLPVTERDPDGRIKKSFTTPSVHESQPIEVTSFIDSIATASNAILEDSDQKHIAITGDAAASGESRREAREAYKQSLEDTKSDVDDCVSNIFEAVLAVVAYLMGNDDRYKDLQVTFNCILNPGPVSVEERRVVREESNEGYRSKESAMEEIGIADPDAMKEKIKTEQEENPSPHED